MSRELTLTEKLKWWIYPAVPRLVVDIIQLDGTIERYVDPDGSKIRIFSGTGSSTVVTPAGTVSVVDASLASRVAKVAINDITYVRRRWITWIIVALAAWFVALYMPVLSLFFPPTQPVPKGGQLYTALVALGGKVYNVTYLDLAGEIVVQSMRETSWSPPYVAWPLLTVMITALVYIFIVVFAEIMAAKVDYLALMQIGNMAYVAAPMPLSRKSPRELVLQLRGATVDILVRALRELQQITYAALHENALLRSQAVEIAKRQRDVVRIAEMNLLNQIGHLAKKTAAGNWLFLLIAFAAGLAVGWALASAFAPGPPPTGSSATVAP
ncbi:MAG: hypothetical protein QXI84_10485 [Thermofilaceae archaeon]